MLSIAPKGNCMVSKKQLLFMSYYFFFHAEDGIRYYKVTGVQTCALPIFQLAGLTLVFEEPDLDTFPLLALARAAGERAGTAPCAYNAANEVAVDAFLNGRLPFLAIAEVVEAALAATDGAPARDVDDVRAADAEARARASRAAVSLQSVSPPFAKASA